MCELLGASLKDKENISDYLSKFFGHGIQHPHGWGIFREQNGKFEIIRETLNSAQSELAKETVINTEPQNHFLAHIRLATAGAVKLKNCHPFSGKDESGQCWTLIHNGTIYSVSRTISYRSAQIGNTDSERVFLYLLDKLNNIYRNQHTPLSEEQRFSVVDETVRELSDRNKLNLIISDGEIIYVHKNMERTLYFLKTHNGYYFSTTPLDSQNWREFPTAQLVSFRDGMRLNIGTYHGNIFTSVMQSISVYEAMSI